MLVVATSPPFLRELSQLGQNYVAELPVSFVGWTIPPPVLHRDHARDKATALGQPPIGRPRQLPRLKVKHTPACAVRDLRLHSPVVRRVPWVRYRVKDGTKGPLVWEAKCVPLWIKDENGLPDGPHPLLIARNVLQPDEVKYFLSNAPLSTPVPTLLLVAFSRWRIERMFEDSKGELGLDHFEVRRYGSIMRHLLLTCVSHLFLAEFVQTRRKKKSRADRVPGADRHPRPGSTLARRRTLLPPQSRSDRSPIGRNAATQRRRRTQPSQANPAVIAGDRNPAAGTTHISVAQNVAL